MNDDDAEDVTVTFTLIWRGPGDVQYDACLCVNGYLDAVARGRTKAEAEAAVRAAYAARSAAWILAARGFTPIAPVGNAP